MEQRLRELRDEFESGQRALSDLATRQATLRNQMMQLSGAIQILEEILTRDTAEQAKPAPAEPASQT